MGEAAQTPGASFAAAVDYALACGLAIGKATAVQAWLPVRWVERLRGRAGCASVATAVLLAIPGMMCTCCAAPIVVGLRARQASSGAAIAFWLGNTVLNPATLVFMGFVLGWNRAAVSLVLGLLMVFGLGSAVNRMATPREAETA